MKLKLAGAVLVAALVPAGALAHHGGTEPNPAHTCKAQQQSMGAAAFKTLYGNFGTCVSRVAKAQNENQAEAMSACAQERAANPTAFAAKYGMKGLGKCVSAVAKQQNAAESQATVRAAKQCKMLTAAQLSAQYGNGKNAFGKCVSARAQAAQNG